MYARAKEKSRGIVRHYDIELDTDNGGECATACKLLPHLTVIPTTHRCDPEQAADPSGIRESKMTKISLRG